jgi:rubredoxin
MDKFKCIICGYVYDPKVGDEMNYINADTDFYELPEHWVCPLCSAEKEQFILI